MRREYMYQSKKRQEKIKTMNNKSEISKCGKYATYLSNCNGMPKIIKVDIEIAQMLDDYNIRPRWVHRAGSRQYPMLTWRAALDGKPAKTQYLHQFVADYYLGECPENLVTDHIDNDCPGDCRINNLRYIPQGLNRLNTRAKKVNASSTFKGVILNRWNSYVTQVSYNSKRICLGSYDDAADAAKMYDLFYSLIYKNMHFEKNFQNKNKYRLDDILYCFAKIKKYLGIDLKIADYKHLIYRYKKDR